MFRWGLSIWRTFAWEGLGSMLRVSQFKISCDYLDQLWNLCFSVCHLLIFTDKQILLRCSVGFLLVEEQGWFCAHYYHLWQTKSTNCLLWFIIWTFNPLSEGSMFVFEIITSSLEPPVTVMGWKTWFVKLLFYFTEWCDVLLQHCDASQQILTTRSRCHAVSRGDTSHIT